MWSLGVMLYILLSGLPPFWGDDESQIFKSVLKVSHHASSITIFALTLLQTNVPD